MGKKELQKKRDKMRALYGLGSDEERLIDVNSNKRDLKRYRFSLAFLTVLAICLAILCYQFDKRGYVFGIGEKSDGERFYGFIEEDELESLQAESSSELPFKYMNVIDILVVGEIGIIVIYSMFAITLIDKIGIAKKSINAYNDYMRRRMILESEEYERELEHKRNVTLNARKISKEDLKG